jgi:hypothetical protein
MTQPTPAQPPPPSSVPRPTGPIGQPRSPGLVIVLSIVTLGIYGLYWDYKTFQELKDHNGEGLGGVVGLILCWLIVGYFLLSAEIAKTYENDGKPAPFGPVIGLWLFLPLIGFIIYILKVQVALNEYWVSKGASPA